MVLSLVYCSMQICFSVRAQLVVVLIVALQNKAELDSYMSCSKRWCQSMFGCTNCDSFFSSSSFFPPSQPGVLYLPVCMSECLCTQSYMCPF